MTPRREPGCPLCDGPGGRLVYQATQWRLIHAGEDGFPGFYRLVWDGHVREFSHLPRADRMSCVDAIATVEGALLRHLQPAKVNIASLGNAVPHLHWHVIARFEWDSHFPGAVWAQRLREPAAGPLQKVSARLPALEEDLVSLLSRGV